jgi:hypothetical protein
MYSIDDVIRKMDAIVEQCSRENLRAGYFAVLYRLVTICIKEEIEAGNFDDNERMERLDTIFAQRFFDAFDAYYNDSGDELTQSWHRAFEAAESNRFIIMQHLLLGINAHINLDLGIAAAQTMECENLEIIHNDYNRINAILASLADDVTSNISGISLFFGPMIRLAHGADEMLVNFSIVVARDGAWEFAHNYLTAEDKELAIQKRDAKIADLAKRLTQTGPFVSFIIKIIRWGEFRSLQSNLVRMM